MRRTCVIRSLAGLFALWLFGFLSPAARAQDQVWLQIEARPSQADAEDRARAYARLFPDVAGFRLPSGWHAILLGPSDAPSARARLDRLRGDGMIPADSFIAEGRSLRDRFWPPPGGAAGTAAIGPALVPLDGAGAGITDLAGPPATPLPPLPADPTPDPTADPPARQTPAEAAAAEAALSRTAREEIQIALQWYGHYAAAIDGDFGRGTRAAMAAWQTASGSEPTGVLTTAEREALVAGYRAEAARLGLAPLREAEAGIEIDLPLALVRFDRYEPPFAVFEPRDDSGVRVLLISQPGDRATLAALFDRLQSLEVVPPGGVLTQGDTAFTLSGSDARLEAHAHAALSGGLVKGYVLVWPRAAGEGLARVLPAMQQSFRAVGDRALDPGLAPLPQAAREGLLSGLEPRRPILSRSGFFVDAAGTVLTTSEVEAGCARLTVDGTQEMAVSLSDPAAGLMVLTPRGALAPAAHARFQTAPERIGAEIVVAGYSFEDALPAPALTFGRIAALSGLAGEPGLKRLDLAALPGDAGGPVIDGTGAVVGMLLPAARGGSRHLPEGIAFAATGAVLAARLAQAGLAVDSAAEAGALPPEDLARRARAMTVLVSCWD